MLSVSLASLQDRRIPQLWASYRVCLSARSCPNLAHRWCSQESKIAVGHREGDDLFSFFSPFLCACVDPSYLGNDLD